MDNISGGLFPRKTVTGATPKGKQAGTGSGTKVKKTRLGVDFETQSSKKEKAAVGAGKFQPCKGMSVGLDGARLVLLPG